MTAWLSIGCLTVQVGLLIFTAVMAWRIHRQWRHVWALDDLLSEIVRQAFVRDHTPIWRAWTQAMGSITVDITQSRKIPEP